MKNSNFLILSIFLLTACTKQETRNTNASSTLEGTWEWYKSFTAMSRPDPISTPQSTGVHWRMIIRSDSTFTISYYGNYIGTTSGIYSFSVSPLSTWGSGTYISMNNDAYPSVPFSTSKYSFSSPDSLVMDSGTQHDGSIIYYVRVR